jgi:hypothetical protein
MVLEQVHELGLAFWLEQRFELPFGQLSKSGVRGGVNGERALALQRSKETGSLEGLLEALEVPRGGFGFQDIFTDDFYGFHNSLHARGWGRSWL